ARGQTAGRRDDQGWFLAGIRARRQGARHRLCRQSAALSRKFLESRLSAASQHRERHCERGVGGRQPDGPSYFPVGLHRRTRPCRHIERNHRVNAARRHQGDGSDCLPQPFRDRAARYFSRGAARRRAVSRARPRHAERGAEGGWGRGFLANGRDHCGAGNGHRRNTSVALASSKDAANTDTMVWTPRPVAVSVAGGGCRPPLGGPLKTAGAWSPAMNVEPAPNPIVAVGKTRFGNGLPLALIAGPCALESREHALEMASALKEIAGKLRIGLVYKTSFDKANRSSAE